MSDSQLGGVFPNLPSRTDTSSSRDIEDFAGVIEAISEALVEADGDFVARIHNSVCSRQLEYIEDSLWEYKKEEA